jgi:hypothetical protein
MNGEIDAVRSNTAALPDVAIHIDGILWLPPAHVLMRQV